MAFGEVEDYSGSLEIVVFPDTLERHRDKFLVDKVLFLRGKIDTGRSAPSFKVEDFLDPGELTAKSWREVHLRLAPGIKSEDDLYELRDILFESRGNCQVFFHVPEGRVAEERATREGGAEQGVAEGQVEARSGIGADDCETDDDGIPIPAASPACADEEESAVIPARQAPLAGPPPKEVLVRANMQILCSPADDVLERFRSLPIVVEAWAS